MNTMSPKRNTDVVGYVKPGAQSWYPFTYLETTRPLTANDIVRGQTVIEGGGLGVVIELDAPSDPYPADGPTVVVGESCLTDTCTPFKFVAERPLAGEDVCFALWVQPGTPPRRRVIVRRPN